MNSMKRYFCSCGGQITFEDKKTFTNPEEKNGICIACKKQYRKIGDKITEKEKK